MQEHFNSIKELRNQVMICFNVLETKQQRLRIATMDFISKNKNNLFIFGLDSFQFQSKYLNIQLTHSYKYKNKRIP